MHTSDPTYHEHIDRAKIGAYTKIADVIFGKQNGRRMLSITSIFQEHAGKIAHNLLRVYSSLEIAGDGVT